MNVRFGPPKSETEHIMWNWQVLLLQIKDANCYSGGDAELRW